MFMTFSHIYLSPELNEFSFRHLCHLVVGDGEGVGVEFIIEAFDVLVSLFDGAEVPFYLRLQPLVLLIQLTFGVSL